MTLEAQYAQALYDLAQTSPDKAAVYLANLTNVVLQKGHTKLLPKIFTAYEHINQKKSRSRAYAQVPPEAERTRVLLELYKKLVAVHL